MYMLKSEKHLEVKSSQDFDFLKISPQQLRCWRWKNIVYSHLTSIKVNDNKKCTVLYLYSKLPIFCWDKKVTPHHICP